MKLITLIFALFILNVFAETKDDSTEVYIDDFNTKIYGVTTSIPWTNPDFPITSISEMKASKFFKMEINQTLISGNPGISYGTTIIPPGLTFANFYEQRIQSQPIMDAEIITTLKYYDTKIGEGLKLTCKINTPVLITATVYNHEGFSISETAEWKPSLTTPPDEEQTLEIPFKGISDLMPNIMYADLDLRFEMSRSLTQNEVVCYSLISTGIEKIFLPYPKHINPSFYMFSSELEWVLADDTFVSVTVEDSTDQQYISLNYGNLQFQSNSPFTLNITKLIPISKTLSMQNLGFSLMIDKYQSLDYKIEVTYANVKYQFPSEETTIRGFNVGAWWNEFEVVEKNVGGLGPNYDDDLLQLSFIFSGTQTNGFIVVDAPYLIFRE